jgi:neutral ceramidase
MLEIGAAKADITTWEPGLGMMGWGMLDNRVEGVATPLHARAVLLRDPESGLRLAIVCVELCFVSLALRDRVCTILRTEHPAMGLDLANTMITATHTHSGPGGYTHYPFYNVTIPGFAPTVLEGLARKIVGAIVEADATRSPGTLRYAEDPFPPDVDVAFNRAVYSYNHNPDVAPMRESDHHLALDRTLRLLRFDSTTGRHIGSINWFAVHGTSVHSDNRAIHFDNKGYAARFVEDELAARGEGGIAAFAQGATGDVTPNYRRHPGRPFMRGRFADDDESARWNGRLQADQALRVLDLAAAAPAKRMRLAHAHAFVDFADVAVDPRFVAGRAGLRTSPAEIGMAMFFGTEEGPGLPRQLRFLQRVLARTRPFWPGRALDRVRTDSQGEKLTWVESGRRRILGIERLRRLPLPWRVSAALRLVRELDRDDASPKPWTPNVLPVQLFVVGELAIAAVPGEFTTVAGIRLRESVRRALAVRRVVLAGYANAYAGYVTTPEEYAVQDYEGASTHFGKWTLPAWQTEFDKLARRLLSGNPRARFEPRPHQFTDEELAVRTFRGNGL